MIDGTMTEKLFSEVEQLKIAQEKLMSDKEDMKIQMETLARDLKGVARLIDCMHNIDEFNDKEATVSAFNNINRLIVDIAASMEATVNDEDFYVG